MNTGSVARTRVIAVLLVGVVLVTGLLLLAESLVGDRGSGQAPAAVIGVPPNPSGTTYINRDTNWSGTLFAGGDIVIGSATQPVTVHWTEGTLTVNGTVYVDSLSGGFKPITLVIDRFTVNLGLPSSEILLDVSDPARTGVATGSTLIITNSTVQGTASDPAAFPLGIKLFSGQGYNLARAQVQDTTLRNMGRGDIGGAIQSRWPSAGDKYSRFTPDSFVRRLTVINPPAEMRSVQVIGVDLGDSLPLEDSQFISGFGGTQFTNIVRRNVFGTASQPICRAIYDPIDNSVVEYNVIYAEYCKTIDFFHPYGTFQNNTCYDCMTNFADGGAVQTKVLDNVFIRSAIRVYWKTDITVRGNVVTGLMSETPGEATAWDFGSGNHYVSNTIRGVITGGIKLEAEGFPTYANPDVYANTIDGFSNLLYAENYPGIKIVVGDGGSIRKNVIANGYLAIHLDQTSGTVVRDNAIENVAKGIKLTGSRDIVLVNNTFLNVRDVEFDLASSTGTIIRDQEMPVRVVSSASVDVRFEWTNLLPSTTYALTRGTSTFAFSTDTAGAGGVTVTNPSGATYAYSLSGAVPPVNTPPVASFIYSPSSPSVGQLVTFDASGSVDSDGTIISYSWKFGDGTTSSGATVQKAYTSAIAYTVTLNVTDNGSASSETSQVVIVGSGPDTTPPARVTDLQATSEGSGTWRLSWTAPGNDGTVGVANEYEVRYSDVGAVDAATWSAAAVLPQSWNPLPAGSLEDHLVAGLDPTVAHWIALRAADPIPNWSDVSNAVFLARQVDPSTLASLMVVPAKNVTRADADVPITAYAYDSAGHRYIVTPNWTAENGSVSASGTLSPWATGTWDVCAVYRNLSDCAGVTVVPGGLNSLSVEPSALRLAVGGSVALTVVAMDLKLNTIWNVTLSWRVEPSSLGHVTKDNVFEAETDGSGYLVLTANDTTKSLTRTLSVSSIPASATDFNGILGLSGSWSLLVLLVVAVLFGASLLGLTSSVRRLRGPGKQEMAEPDVELEYRCPRCDAVVQAEDSQCPGCGAQFEA